MIKRIVLAGIWVSDQDASVNFILINLDLRYKPIRLWERVTDGWKLFLPVQIPH